jgi:serine/threonine protein phosphatase PrpC
MYRLSHFSEAGGHRINEDAFEVRPHPADPACWLCALADGQGGQAGGARAAQLACRSVIEAAVALPVRVLTDIATWATLLRQADMAVLADADAGYTTLVGFTLSGRQIAGSSNGDCAVWLAGEGEQVDDLTALQAKNPPVGSGSAAIVPFTARLQGMWQVLAMSDGVWKYVGGEQVGVLAAKLRGQDLIDKLQALARLPGSGRFPDDFTIVVLGAES